MENQSQISFLVLYENRSRVWGKEKHRIDKVAVIEAEDGGPFVQKRTSSVIMFELKRSIVLANWLTRSLT